VTKTLIKEELKPNKALQLTSIQQLECFISSLYCRIFHHYSSAGLPQLC